MLPLYTRVAVSGNSLDASHSRVLKDTFIKLQQDGVRNIITDLSHCDICDDTGLGILLIGARLCRNAGGCMLLVLNGTYIKERIKEKELNRVLKIFSSFQEAVDYLEGVQNS